LWGDGDVEEEEEEEVDVEYGPKGLSRWVNTPGGFAHAGFDIDTTNSQKRHMTDYSTRAWKETGVGRHVLWIFSLMMQDVSMTGGQRDWLEYAFGFYRPVLLHTLFSWFL